jgi:hypothetical protein
VDVFEIGGFTAAPGAVVDDFALDLTLFEVDDRHGFKLSEFQ